MKTITRKELYDKIWSMTKSKTATELNLKFSDLSKICQEHNIPSPSSRYWQLLAWGEKVEKTPLPDPDNDTVISLPSISLTSSPRKDGNNPTRKNKTDYSAILDAELANAMNENKRKKMMREAMKGKYIVDIQKPVESWLDNADKVVRIFRVPDHLKSRREIIFQTKAYFRLSRLSWNERMSHPDYEKLKTHLDIDTSERFYDRSLRVFDTLINIYEALGGKMKYGNDKTTVTFGETEIRVRISERNKRVEHAESEHRYLTRYDYVPSGKLRVKLEWRWSEYKIEDTDYCKIEEKLDSLVRRTLNYIKEERDWEERRRQEELKRKREEEERRKEEERRRELEMLRNIERNHVRLMFSELKREMIVSFIDNLLSRRAIEETSGSDSSEADSGALKLESLRNMFSTRRTYEIETHLTEIDIDNLANEFFSGTSD